MMRWVIAGLIAIAGLFLSWVVASPASAGLVTFNLSDCGEAGLGPAFCPNKNAGTPILDFLSGGLDLSVEGFAGAAPNNLFLKQSTPDETGLGLAGPAVGGAGSVANEVAAGDSEVFNFGKLALVGIDSGSITISSLQDGEVGLVTFDTTGVAAVEVDGTGISSPIPITWSLADPFVTVTAIGGDVLAAADVEVSVEEPGSWLLAATALLGLGLLGRRRPWA
jgi:MYXO-CTERM domain-containing protein